MKQVELVACYLPSIVVSYLVDHDPIASAPVRQSFSTVCMFADVSGFTALSEAMARYGPEGAEYLAKHLNSYFSQMVKIIASMGGDIFKFAGDAMLVLWPDDPEMSLEERVARAGQCALEIQSNLHKAELQDGVTLSVKIGIGVGEVSVLHMGGVLRRMEYVAVGEPLVQAFAAEHHAEAGGDVILSPRAHALVPASFRIVETLSDGAVQIARDGKGDCLKPLKRISINRLLRGGSLEEAGDEVEHRLRNYVAGAILPWINPIAPEQEVLGSDLRNVTVLFVNMGLKDMDMLAASKYDDAMVRMHNVLRAAQSAVYAFEGAVNKCLNDDKGSTLIAVFGLPPLSHEDDASRGILCGLNICERLWQLGLTASVGVTTGVVFCGVVGSTTRKEYTILGDTVNLSARLMQKAGSIGGGVLCDLQIRRAASGGLAFQELETIMVKGKSVPIRVFRPYPAGLMKCLPPRAAPGTEPSYYKLAFEAQMAGFKSYRLMRPLELPPPIPGDGVKDPGEVEAAAAAASGGGKGGAGGAGAATGGAGTGGSGGGGSGGGGLERGGGSTTRSSVRRGTIFGGRGAGMASSSALGSGGAGGAGGPGARDRVLNVEDVFGSATLAAIGGSTDGEATVDEDGLPVSELYGVPLKMKSALQGLALAGGKAAGGGRGGSGGGSIGISSPVGGRVGGGASGGAGSGRLGGGGVGVAASHLSRPEIPVAMLRSLLVRPPAELSVDNAAFRGLPAVVSLTVSVPKDLEHRQSLDLRVSYETTDSTPLPATVPFPVMGDEEDDEEEEDGTSGDKPAKPRTLGALRDAAVAAAKAAGRVHSSLPASEFLLRVHGTDALVPASYTLPLVYLWLFVHEAGAMVLDDVIAAGRSLRVQLVRLRDKHALQTSQAQAMQTLIECKMALVASGQGSGTIIEGGFGLGKTSLLTRFLTDVMPGSTSVFTACGSPFSRVNPYATWGEMLGGYLKEYADAHSCGSPTDAAAVLLKAHAAEALLPYAHTVNGILDVLLPEPPGGAASAAAAAAAAAGAASATATTPPSAAVAALPPPASAASLKPKERDRVIRGLLLALLRSIGDKIPAVIVCDDGVFMHKASWQVAADLAEAACLPAGTPGACKVQLVLATRPVGQYLDVVAPEPPPAYTHLMAAPWMSIITLSRVHQSETLTALAASVRWGGLVSQDVLTLVEGKTHGNPAMITEVMLSLIGRGRLMCCEMGSPMANSGGAMLPTQLPRLVALFGRSLSATSGGSSSSSSRTPGGLSRAASSTLAGAHQSPVGASFRDLLALSGGPPAGVGSPVGLGARRTGLGGLGAGLETITEGGTGGAASGGDTPSKGAKGGADDDDADSGAAGGAAAAAGASSALSSRRISAGGGVLTPALTKAIMVTQAAVAAGAGLARIGAGWVSITGLLGAVAGIVSRRSTLLGVDLATGSPTAVLVLTEGLAHTHVPYCRRSHWSISARVDRLSILEQLVMKVGSLIGKNIRHTLAAVNLAATVASPFALLNQSGTGSAMPLALPLTAGASASAAPGTPPMGASTPGGTGSAPGTPSKSAPFASNGASMRRSTLAPGNREAAAAMATTTGGTLAGSTTGSSSGGDPRFTITFRFDILAGVFPLEFIRTDRQALAALCVSLVRSGLLTHGFVRGRPSSSSSSSSNRTSAGSSGCEAVLTFNGGFLPDTVRFRMLKEQQKGVEKKIADCVQRYEAYLKQSMLNKMMMTASGAGNSAVMMMMAAAGGGGDGSGAGGRLTDGDGSGGSSGGRGAGGGGSGAGGGLPTRSAWMRVRKNPDSALAALAFLTRGTAKRDWKTRWLVLSPTDGLSMYKEAEGASKPVQVIELRGARTSIVPGDAATVEASTGQKHVIRLDANSWEKKGKRHTTGRAFYIAAESQADAEDWALWLQTSINLATTGSPASPGSSRIMSVGRSPALSAGSPASASSSSTSAGGGPMSPPSAFPRPMSSSSASATDAIGSPTPFALSGGQKDRSISESGSVGGDGGGDAMSPLAISGAPGGDLPGVGAGSAASGGAGIGGASAAELAEASELQETFSPSPSGLSLRGDRLLVTVEEAQRLTPAKYSGVPNVFATISLAGNAGTTASTPLAPGTLDPIWASTLGLPMGTPAGAQAAARGTLVLRLFDRDKEGADQLMGVAELPLCCVPIAEEESKAKRGSSASGSAAGGAASAGDGTAADDAVGADADAVGLADDDDDDDDDTGFGSAYREEEAVKQAAAPEILLYIRARRGFMTAPHMAMGRDAKTVVTSSATKAAAAAGGAASSGGAAAVDAATPPAAVPSRFLPLLRVSGPLPPDGGVVIIRARLVLSPAAAAAARAERERLCLPAALPPSVGIISGSDGASTVTVDDASSTSGSDAATPYSALSLSNRSLPIREDGFDWLAAYGAAPDGLDGTSEPLSPLAAVAAQQAAAALGRRGSTATPHATPVMTGTIALPPSTPGGDGAATIGSDGSATPSVDGISALGGAGGARGSAHKRLTLGSVDDLTALDIDTTGSGGGGGAGGGPHGGGLPSVHSARGRGSKPRASMIRFGAAPLHASSSLSLAGGHMPMLSATRSAMNLSPATMLGTAHDGGSPMSPVGAALLGSASQPGSAFNLRAVAAAQSRASVGGFGSTALLTSPNAVGEGGKAGGEEGSLGPRRSTRPSLAVSLVSNMAAANGAPLSAAGGAAGGRTGDPLSLSGLAAMAVSAAVAEAAGEAGFQFGPAGGPGGLGEVSGILQSVVTWLRTEAAAAVTVDEDGNPVEGARGPGKRLEDESDGSDYSSASDADEDSATAAPGALASISEATGDGKRRSTKRLLDKSLLASLTTDGSPQMVVMPAGRLQELYVALRSALKTLRSCPALLTDGTGSHSPPAGALARRASAMALRDADRGDAPKDGAGEVAVAAMTAMQVDETSKRWLTSEYSKVSVPTPVATGDAASSDKAATPAADAGATSPRGKITGAGAAAAAPPVAAAVATPPPAASPPKPAAAAGGAAAATPSSTLATIRGNVVDMPYEKRSLSLVGDLLYGPGTAAASEGWLGWGLYHIPTLLEPAPDGSSASDAATPDALLADETQHVVMPAVADASKFEATLKAKQRARDAYDAIFYEDAEDHMHGPFNARQIVEWVVDGDLPTDAAIRPGGPGADQVALDSVLPQLRVRALLSRAVELSRLGGDMDKWTYDIWALQAASPEELLPLPVAILLRLRLPRFFKMPENAVLNFVEAVCERMSLHGEGVTSYHNFYHAVDVLQSMNALLVQMQAIRLFTPVETAALAFAALCHDLEHPGVNNAFLVNTNDPLALRYNDASVLESHHAAVAFTLLREHGVVDGFSKQQYKELRKATTAVILATDMTCHFSLTEEFKTAALTNARRVQYLLQGDGAAGVGKTLADAAGAASGAAAPPPDELVDISPADRLVMAKNLLHAADISNSCKPWRVAKFWSDRVLQEFFNQGDREAAAGLPISANMDRRTTRQSQLSCNFIDFVVAPLFIAVATLLPESQQCVDLLNDNRRTWADMLKVDIEAEKGVSAADKEEEKRRWSRRNTAFHTLQAVVREANGGGGKAGDGAGAVDAEAQVAARVLSLHALQTMASAATTPVLPSSSTTTTTTSGTASAAAATASTPAKKP